jgi:hypothetical protein
MNYSKDTITRLIETIAHDTEYKIAHNDTVSQIEHIFRENGFYTTREYPIFKIKDKSGRAGRIDLVAREGKFRVAVEYDHHALIKWKSFQKIVQIKPDVAIAITGNGSLGPNLERAEKYHKYLNSELYVISLKQRKYQKFDRTSK